MAKIVTGRLGRGSRAGQHESLLPALAVSTRRCASSPARLEGAGGARSDHGRWYAGPRSRICGGSATSRLPPSARARHWKPPRRLAPSSRHRSVRAAAPLHRRRRAVRDRFELSSRSGAGNGGEQARRATSILRLSTDPTPAPRPGQADFPNAVPNPPARAGRPAGGCTMPPARPIDLRLAPRLADAIAACFAAPAATTSATGSAG